MPLTRTLADGSPGWLAMLAAIVIVYGSLLPFEYRAVPLDQAIESFRHLRWGAVAPENRADWVANIVLYMPLGFFTCGAVSRRTLVGAIIVTALLGAILAAGVEFAQIWASPRTVSLNDIVAEIAGTSLGILGWVLGGRWAVRAIRTASAGGSGAVSAAIALYLLAYIFIALFPFDFVVTWAELEARMADPNAIVLVPEQSLSGRGLVYLILKAGLMLPLGAVAKLLWRRGVGAAVLSAAALSTVIEITQLFEYSGRMDAISIAIAVLGAWLGYITADSLRKSLLRGMLWLPAAAWLAVPAYLAALPVLRGWRVGYAGGQQIDETIASLHWLPFYYHYFTSEQKALASSLTIAASYAPVGAFVWAVRWRPDQPAQSRPLGYSGLAAAVLAAFMEAGGLFTTGLRPDPTNVLIAAAAAMVTQRICEWASRIGPDVLRPQSTAK